MAALLPPPIVFQSARWSTELLTATALAWRSVLVETGRRSAGPIALVMANHPESVAAFFALSTFRSPIVLLPLDLRPWLTLPPIPPGTPVVLLPGQEDLAGDVRAAGMTPVVLPAPER